MFEMTQRIEPSGVSGRKAVLRSELCRHGKTVLLVELPVKLTGNWRLAVPYEGRRFAMECGYGGEHRVFENDSAIGTIGRRPSVREGEFAIDLPDTVPLVLRIFLFTPALAWR